MNVNIIREIENILNQKIIASNLLSNSFNINCMKIITKDKEKFVVKFYEKKNEGFNAINAEAMNLNFLNKEKINLFPKVISNDEKFLITKYVDHNKKKPNTINKEFISHLIFLHSKYYDKFGFFFDTQIGGMCQPNSFDYNWINFFREKRLNYIFEVISKTNPLPKKISKKLEKLIQSLNNKIPPNPKPSLLHGDLWEGNILFNDGKLVSLIDPGSFYGHNEMEIAYLRWFNLIDQDFFKIYSKFIRIDKVYFSYEPIYQLYYSLLNLHLWDRSYIQNVESLLNKIKI